VPLSAREVNRLGERIKAGPLTEDDRRLLLEFRASFLPAYQEVIAKIREALEVDPTGRPEKTPESIIAKLRRGDVKNLASMQDIAGCRIVVDSRYLQDKWVEAIRGLFEKAKPIDRRQDPSHGYRAVHVIVRTRGRQIEVQVRTSLEDRWANVVERFTETMGVDFKHGEQAPDDPWLKWLELGAECIDRVERMDNPELVQGLDNHELDRYRRGQFSALMLLVPYIRELSQVPGE